MKDLAFLSLSVPPHVYQRIFYLYLEAAFIFLKNCIVYINEKEDLAERTNFVIYLDGEILYNSYMSLYILFYLRISSAACLWAEAETPIMLLFPDFFTPLTALPSMSPPWIVPKLTG